MEFSRLHIQVCNSCHLDFQIHMASKAEKTNCVLWFHKVKSVITVQRIQRFLLQESSNDMLFQGYEVTLNFHHEVRSSLDSHFPGNGLSGMGQSLSCLIHPT
jgi:hypothetical protein